MNSSDGNCYQFSGDRLFFFFLVYFWLHWPFFAACGLSLVVAILLRSMGSGAQGQ